MIDIHWEDTLSFRNIYTKQVKRCSINSKKFYSWFIKCIEERKEGAIEPLTEYDRKLANAKWLEYKQKGIL